jgi:hypothetical protein
MLTKAQARTMIRQYLTDAEKQVWGDATIDVITQLSIDELYGTLLNDAPWYVSNLDTIAVSGVTSPGYIDLTSSGPLTKRFYRAQKVVRDSQEYSLGDLHDSLVFSNAQVSASQFTYTISGSQLWLYPLSTATGIELRYSYLPTAFTSLVDTDNVPWIDGFDNAYIYDAVMRMVDDQARLQKYSGLQARSWDSLMSRVRREYVGPGGMNLTDYPAEIGGE